MRTARLWAGGGRARRGSALLMVIWALLVMGAATFAWATVVQNYLIEANEENLRVAARAAAMSGLAVAWHPQVKEDSLLLQDIFITDQQRAQVQVEGEGGRINLNWLVGRAAADPEAKKQLDRFLEGFGLELDERQVLADSLIDWFDEDDLRRLNGRETDAAYFAGNRPFETLDEVEAVYGIEAMAKVPHWRDYFTLWSSGPIDVNWAPVEVLKSLPGLDEVRARRIVEYRDGKDGIRFTEDDGKIENLEQLRPIAGLSQAAIEVLGQWATAQDQAKRYVSIGTAEHLTHRISVVARLENGRATILNWREK